MTTPRPRPTPLGILDPHATARRLTLARYAPPADLAPWIERFWVVRWHLETREPHTQETLPHPCVNLTVEDGRALVSGVFRQRFTRTLAGHGDVFGVKFRPASFRALLRGPVAALTGRVVPATALLPAAAVQTFEAAVAAAASDDAACVAAASAFVRAIAPPPDALAARLNALVDEIAADRELTRVDQVATRFGVHPRTLQRLFRDHLGVSPKWVIGRYRLQLAVDRVAHGERVDWAELATELGTFDQAHFINDFKALVGATPAEYARLATPPG